MAACSPPTGRVLDTGAAGWRDPQADVVPEPVAGTSFSLSTATGPHGPLSFWEFSGLVSFQ